MRHYKKVEELRHGDIVVVTNLEEEAYLFVMSVARTADGKAMVRFLTDADAVVERTYFQGKEVMVL